MTAIDAAIIKALVEHIGGKPDSIPDGTIGGGGGATYTAVEPMYISNDNKISLGYSPTTFKTIDVYGSKMLDLVTPSGLHTPFMNLEGTASSFITYAGGNSYATINPQIPLKNGDMIKLKDAKNYNICIFIVSEVVAKLEYKLTCVNPEVMSETYYDEFTVTRSSETEFYTINVPEFTEHFVVPSLYANDMNGGYFPVNTSLFNSLEILFKYFLTKNTA